MLYEVITNGASSVQKVKRMRTLQAVFICRKHQFFFNHSRGFSVITSYSIHYTKLYELVKVSTCGVCHTELDEIEGRTPPSRLPMVLGHQVVGRVQKKGPHAGRYKTGNRVGIAWIYSACGHCDFCRQGEENLCEAFRATGRDANGGYVV